MPKDACMNTYDTITYNRKITVTHISFRSKKNTKLCHIHEIRYCILLKLSQQMSYSWIDHILEDSRLLCFIFIPL